jgi:hypothetical protein
MMLEIEVKSEVDEQSVGRNSFRILELKSDEFGNLVTSLIGELPDYYVDPESVASTLERLGKSASAQKLRAKLPEVKKIRSGDLGEVITTAYIEESTDFTVPIRKLRWGDHPNMAMRGDDVIGIYVNQEQQTLRFIKAEAKANKSMSSDVLEKARVELDSDGGLPAPHALEFVAERLREAGEIELSNLIEKVQLVDGIRTDQVEHLLFTFTSSDPRTLQKTAFEAYSGNIKQSSVCFRVNTHQELIESVYQGVLNGLDD